MALEAEMSEQDPGSSTPSESLRSPDHDRSGSTVAEAGSQVEGDLTPPGREASGESRAERMVDVEGVTNGRVDGNPDEATTPPKPGPSPAETGSGGAQRIVGARISDRVAAGEAVPDGPPFDTDSEGNTQD